MIFNYAKLNGRIVEICGTQSEFAQLMGLSERSISLKLNNKLGFKQSEIVKALNVLKLGTHDIRVYFFTPSVQNI